MNKVIVKLYIPMLAQCYDVWLPLNKKIYKVTNLLVKIVNEFSDGYYKPINTPVLYDKSTAKAYDINLTVKESDIKNGTEIILI